MATYIRPRKDGGFSECSSPDDLVGKRRCCHILDGNADKMTLKHIQRGMYEVEVNDSTMTISAQKQTIIDFFNKLPTLPEEKQNKIIEFLEKE